MMQIEMWIQSSLAIATAKTLLHSVWQATLAGFALAACLPFIRPARFRYAAAYAAMLAVIVAAAGTFLLVAQGSEGRHLSYPAMQWRAVILPASIDAAASPSNQSTLQKALRWITPVWLLGFLLINLKHIGSWSGARRMRRRGVCVAPDAWQQKLHELQHRMKLSRPVLLLESCLTQVPLVIGHLRPAILMPIGLLAGLPAEQVELLLMHELAHIARYDYAINLLQTFVESLMFYNPAIWWISNLIRTEREHCCDDLVVQAPGAAPIYAAALIALEESRHSQLAMAATGGSLMKRIRRVLRQPEPSSSIAVPVISTAMIILIAGGLLVARPAVRLQPARTVTAASPVSSPAPPQPESSPAAVAKSPVRAQAPLALAYQRWLDEDVVYIILPEERVAFLGLTTDGERNQFIEQFWLRRDPTPGTPENEYKDEVYRRIQYANEHFTSNVPLPGGAGWRMDRGRFYIMYGPPDELESHPSGGTYDRPADQGAGTIPTSPFEIWLYRHIDGVGNQVLIEFVDSNGTGEYRRAVTPNSPSGGARGRGAR